MRIAITTQEKTTEYGKTNIVVPQNIIRELYISGATIFTIYSWREALDAIHECDGLIVSKSSSNIDTDEYKMLQQLVLGLEELNKPILAIGGGMNILNNIFGGKSTKTNKRGFNEFRKVEFLDERDRLSSVFKKMSFDNAKHDICIERLSSMFHATIKSDDVIEAIADESGTIFGIQWQEENLNSIMFSHLIGNFVDMCR